MTLPVHNSVNEKWGTDESWSAGGSDVGGLAGSWIGPWEFGEFHVGGLRKSDVPSYSFHTETAIGARNPVDGDATMDTWQ